MMTKLIKLLEALLLFLAIGVVTTGCTTTSSTKAKALSPAIGSGVDLSKYQTITVLPFEPTPGKEIDASVGVKFSDGIALRIQNDFGALFQEVRRAAPLGKADELIVTGSIRKYEPGSRFGRAMLIGVGSASFEGEMVLKDATDQHVLYSATFDKLWAWGGVLGMSKGIEDMLAETEAAVAATIARAKGWKPVSGGSKGK